MYAGHAARYIDTALEVHTPDHRGKTMCMIRIPFLSRTADGQPLQRCIDKAASRGGMGADAVVQVMSLFLEAIADELAKGRAVRIPGWAWPAT